MLTYYLIQKSYTEDWRTVIHLVLYCNDNSLKREFVFVPSMCESAGKYFEAPEPTIESFLAEPCSAEEQDTYIAASKRTSLTIKK